jgi:hypothetical protein
MEKSMRVKVFSFLVLVSVLFVGLAQAPVAVAQENGDHLLAISEISTDPKSGEAVLADSLWGDDPSPCEATFGFDPGLRITIPLHQRERELIHLAMEGFIADLEHEAVGTSNAVPPFELRAGFLQFFITAVVPSIQSRVAGRFENEYPTPENEAAMMASVQNVEFGGCERSALSIAIEKWSVKSGGQMAAHLKLCQASQEMNASTACQSFYPLGEAYDSLTKMIEKDQN